MARRAASELAMTATESASGNSLFRYVFGTVFAALSVVLVMFTASRVEQFFISDSRFVLPTAPENGAPNPNFSMEGLFYTADTQVMQVFARDFGRSIYLCPIQERRHMLMGIDWVKEATVSRIWPNKLYVKVVERTPVAFVQVAGAHGGTQFGLIDTEGVLLDPKRVANLKLPVMIGVTAADTEEVRRQRVKRLLRLKQELGPDIMAKLSEIDISDLENIKVTEKFDRHAVVLMLGNHDFLPRMNNFTANYDQIRMRLVDARLLDLRLKDRITAVGGDSRVE
ncbi:MAG: FtsQ-type POTRA domain-containing protein [Bryobacteraceae bacterium]